MSLKPTRTKTKSPASSTNSGLQFKKKSKKEPNRSFVIYGPSGTGKTTLSGTFPKPILFADVKDRGTDSISEYSEDEIRITEIESFEDIELLVEEIRANPGLYKTVVIDTVTQMQQLAIEEVVAAKKKKTKKAAGDWGSMTMRDWGDVSSKMKEWIIALRDLPVQTVFLAQHRVFNSSDEGDDAEEQLAPEVGPRLSPSTASHLNAAVDVIGSTFIRERIVVKTVNGKKVKKKKTEYCLRIGPNPIYTSKIRKPKNIEVPDFVVNPSYEDIVAIIKGEVE